MINPGVIQLASLKHSSYRFDIEDNIGESIHIHYNNIRLDYSIRDFFELADEIEKLMDVLLLDKNISSYDFDSAFFVDLAGLIPDLEKITYDTVNLDELFVDTYNEDGNVVVRPLNESRVLKALNGNSEENDSKEQNNYFSAKSHRLISNRERLSFNLERIKQNDGFQPNDFVTLFNHRNTIRDGQHSAACLYYLKGNVSVPVRRLWFKGDAYAFVPERKNAGFYGSLFFDTGDGFSEDKKIVFDTDDVIIGKKFEIPKNTVKIRYDPIEGAFCRVTDLEIKGSNGILSISNDNYIGNGIYEFYTDDPQIFINIGSCSELWIEIKSTIMRVSFFEITMLLRKLENEGKVLMNEKKVLMNEKNVLMNEKETLENEKKALINSASWKITKPLREIKGLIKKCIKKY